MGQGVVAGTKENGLPVGKLFFVVEGPPAKVWPIPGNPPDARLINPNTDPPWILNPTTRTWGPPPHSIIQAATTIIDAGNTAEKVGIGIGVLVFLGILWRAFKSASPQGTK
jgi:hypothetical protein